jgi:hypothetical protein
MRKKLAVFGGTVEMVHQTGTLRALVIHERGRDERAPNLKS